MRFVPAGASPADSFTLSTFSFWYGILPGILPGSFCSQAWCGDFQFWGMRSAVFLQCFCIFRSKSSKFRQTFCHMNVLSNMLTGVLEGSSARVLQCSPFPTDTDAVFNSFSKQSCLHITCSLSPYLCPVGCFREILFTQTNKELSLEPVGFFRHLLPGRRKVPHFF